jgi:hypothetical protein
MATVPVVKPLLVAAAALCLPGAGLVSVAAIPQQQSAPHGHHPATGATGLGGALPPLTAEWRVGVDDTAPPQERWAAQQLARHLGRWLGLAQPLAVRSPAGVGDDPAIVVGAAAAAPAAPPGTLRGLGPEGFWCRSSGGPTPRIFLSGGLNATCVTPSPFPPAHF